jgi:type I restriction enzyme S subunit
MDTKALRQKVLDLAIRGKLVPQDPNDEPASVLLERIRQQKQQMVKEGKLKAKDIKNDSVIFIGEDSLHYEKLQDGTVKCIEDEIPFEVPEGWAWSRLNSISEIITKGASPKWQGVDYTTSGTLFVTSENVGTETLLLDSPKYLSDHINEIQPRSVLKKHDILTNIVGASIGRTCKYTLDVLANTNQAVAIVRLVDLCLVDFIIKCLNSAYCIVLMFENQVNVARANLSLSSLANFLIPIPPFCEMQRIMGKISLMFIHIDTISAERTALNDTISKAKSKILDLAIRGQLVPQNPADEPASVLLERIRTEKEELIRQGKIKRDKKESVIFKSEDSAYYEKIADGRVKCIEDEIPFELPDNWMWCRLGNIGNWQTGATPNRRNPKYYEGAIPWIKTGDLNNGYITEVPEAITELALAETSVKVIPSYTVIIAMYGATIGKVGITTFESTTNQACCACCNPQVVREKYLFYYLMSHKDAFVAMAEGGAQPNISKEKIVATLIPIPPYEEQTRITQIIDNSFSILDRAEKSLS